MNAEIPTMFALALLSVSMWTFRVAIAARGLKLACAAVAATEAIVFALTFSRLVADLGSPVRLLSYASGVAAGTAIGLLVNDRTTRGHTELHLVAPGDRSDVVDCFRERAWPATSAVAAGPDGPVTMMWLTVADAEIREVTHVVQQLVPEAFWTLRRLDKVNLSSAERSVRTSASGYRERRPTVRVQYPGCHRPNTPNTST